MEISSIKCQRSGVVTLYKKWFVVCSHDLYAGCTRVGPYELKADAEAACPAIRDKGMGNGRAWDEVEVEELECINNGGWYVLESVVPAAGY